MLMRPQEPVDGAGPSTSKRPIEIYLEVAEAKPPQGMKIV